MGALERAHIEIEEKQKMMMEAEEARRVAEEKAEEARLKSIEALKLEEELISANRKVEESQRKLADVTSKNILQAPTTNGDSMTNGNHNHTERISQQPLNNNHLEDNDHNDEDDDNNKDNNVELQSNESLPPEIYRETAMDKNQKMKQQLEELRKHLDQNKDPQKQTKEDQIHQDNVKEGRDKYKTLKQIRQGNTKKRIDEFESI